jgi:hypothetical protein
VLINAKAGEAMTGIMKRLKADVAKGGRG